MDENPATPADYARPLWEQNGMDEEAWFSLPDEARAWRSEHPRIDAPVEVLPVSDNVSADVGLPAAVVPVGGVEVLTGAAAAAARGELHGSIEHNTAAREKEAGG